jgi:hypothetical protein
VASAEGDDRTPIVSGESEELLAKFDRQTALFDRVIDRRPTYAHKELFCDGHHIAGAAAALGLVSRTRENSYGQNDPCR